MDKRAPRFGLWVLGCAMLLLCALILHPGTAEARVIVNNTAQVCGGGQDPQEGSISAQDVKWALHEGEVALLVSTSGWPETARVEIRYSGEGGRTDHVAVNQAHFLRGLLLQVQPCWWSTSPAIG